MKTEIKKQEQHKLKVKKKVVKKSESAKDATTMEYTTPTITWTIF